MKIGIGKKTSFVTVKNTHFKKYLKKTPRQNFNTR